MFNSRRLSYHDARYLVSSTRVVKSKLDLALWRFICRLGRNSNGIQIVYNQLLTIYSRRI